MTETVERMLPLYEGKMIHIYDHQWATFEPSGSVREVTPQEKADVRFSVLPRYWMREDLVANRLDGKWDLDWLLGFRDICRSTDERTMICSRLPTTAVGHTLPLSLTAENLVLLQVAWSSFVFDFVARQKVGGTHMTYSYLEQLATPPPDFTPVWKGANSDWFVRRAVYLQSPEAWTDNSPRSTVKAELDAAMFQIYGVPRDDVEYIMDTFPIVKRKDEAAHGEYRTKRIILDIYDAMQRAIDSGVPYEPIVDLPPLEVSPDQRQEP
jgi:hypothetical protein